MCKAIFMLKVLHYLSRGGAFALGEQISSRHCFWEGNQFVLKPHPQSSMDNMELSWSVKMLYHSSYTLPAPTGCSDIYRCHAAILT